MCDGIQVCSSDVCSDAQRIISVTEVWRGRSTTEVSTNINKENMYIINFKFIRNPRAFSVYLFIIKIRSDSVRK